MKITTRRGDTGQTGMYSGETVGKDDPRLELIGDLDELVSAMGTARAAALREGIAEAILDVQKQIFTACAEISASDETVDQLNKRIGREEIGILEQAMNEMESSVEWQDVFVIPGRTSCGAHLDLARAVARRAERRLVALMRGREERYALLLIWLNRLSDYLWILARFEEQHSTLLDTFS